MGIHCIWTPGGYKFFRLRNGGNTNTSRGTLSESGSARYFDFSIKLVF